MKWLGYEKEEDRTWEAEETLTYNSPRSHIQESSKIEAELLRSSSESANDVLSDYYNSIGGRPAGDTIATRSSKSKSKKKKNSTSSISKPKQRAPPTKHPRSSDSELDMKWIPKGDFWDNQIDEVISLEQDPKEGLIVLANLKNGKSVKCATTEAYKKIPQKMLLFYESKL